MFIHGWLTWCWKAGWLGWWIGASRSSIMLYSWEIVWKIFIGRCLDWLLCSWWIRKDCYSDLTPTVTSVQTCLSLPSPTPCHWLQSLWNLLYSDDSITGYYIADKYKYKGTICPHISLSWWVQIGFLPSTSWKLLVLVRE